MAPPAARHPLHRPCGGIRSASAGGSANAVRAPCGLGPVSRGRQRPPGPPPGLLGLRAAGALCRLAAWQGRLPGRASWVSLLCRAGCPPAGTGTAISAGSTLRRYGLPALRAAAAALRALGSRHHGALGRRCGRGQRPTRTPVPATTVIPGHARADGSARAGPSPPAPRSPRPCRSGTRSCGDCGTCRHRLSLRSSGAAPLSRRAAAPPCRAPPPRRRRTRPRRRSRAHRALQERVRRRPAGPAAARRPTARLLRPARPRHRHRPSSRVTRCLHAREPPAAATVARRPRPSGTSSTYALPLMPGTSCVCSTPPCARTIPRTIGSCTGSPPGVRPAHLDPYDLAALRRRHHDRRVARSRRRGTGALPGRVDARDVRDRDARAPVASRSRVDLGLDGRRVHRELRPPGPDQLDRARRRRPRRPRRAAPSSVTSFSVAGVQPLVAQHVVDEGRDPGVAGRQVVQDLVGLGPQLARPGRRRARSVRRAARPAGRAATRRARRAAVVPRGQRLVSRSFCALAERGRVPLARGRRAPRRAARSAPSSSAVVPSRRSAVSLGGVRSRVELRRAAPSCCLARRLLVERVVGRRSVNVITAPTSWSPSRTGAVVRSTGTARRPWPQHLPAHPVLAPGAQGVGERGLLVRERAAVGARVVDQRVQLLAAEVAGPVAQDLRGGRVDEDDPALGVHADHALGRGPQDHLGLPLRRASSASVSTVPVRSRTTSISSSSPV